ncbi:hypothetical protein QRC92_000235 [Vibrio parahaemolyticus]|uniref:hypothetical protein n=1 Tax=Vibrio parahaemolyticus TaxID=670 RepID=UPI0003FF353B|nr:hypothetical protein [Vibrio parahaemolyticus]KIT29131.1 hypothetical protein H323_03250 [Vibrio parahaemolyticus VP766]EGR2769760.1 hypothetical protein [Vibrio parahaemolyticus]EGR2834048.1 hypothetical protein [Vibrio parahaemolyticus]EGR2886915.1 hypothetical protein [Vibrio parahaemolyticus]EGR2909386.1 hypothetical protein [Vibrio parahaemolyticus]
MNNRKVSILLGIGIALIPLVFSWFTLRKGYSRKSKIISFSWLFLTCLLVGISPSKNESVTNSSDTNQAVQEVKADPQEIIKESSVDNQPTTELENPLANLGDCELSKLMLDETGPLLTKAVSFVDIADYREIAQWRTTTFNSSISQIEDKYRLSPKEARSANRSLSTQIHNDFVNRTRLLVQEIYNHVRNGGDKSAIQEQWQIIKKTGELYAQQCEQPKKAENTPKAKPTKLLVKMSNTGVCHSPSSSWYNRTKNYTAYQSIESCIANGGRLPKK